MKTKTVAVYLDTENIQGNISIQGLLDDINLKVTGEDEFLKTVFAFKKAVGNHESISRFRDQLKELNFEIQDAPHVAQKKNRADLIISLDAFEKIYLGNPEIDLFIFLTSDSDYSIIMSILRRYNKEVWMVASEKDAQRTIFKSSTDNILLVSDYEIKKPTKAKTTNNGTTAKNRFNLSKEEDKRALVAILKVLKSYTQEKPYIKGNTNNSFRIMERTLDMTDTKFKNFNGLYDFLDTNGIIKFQKNKTGDDHITIMNKRDITKLLNEYSN